MQHKRLVVDLIGRHISKRTAKSHSASITPSKLVHQGSHNEKLHPPTCLYLTTFRKACYVLCPNIYCLAIFDHGIHNQILFLSKVEM